MGVCLPTFFVFAVSVCDGVANMHSSFPPSLQPLCQPANLSADCSSHHLRQGRANARLREQQGCKGCLIVCCCTEDTRTGEAARAATKRALALGLGAKTACSRLSPGVFVSSMHPLQNKPSHPTLGHFPLRFAVTPLRCVAASFALFLLPSSSFSFSLTLFFSSFNPLNLRLSRSRYLVHPLSFSACRQLCRHSQR